MRSLIKKETTKRNQIEILGLKTKIIELENSIVSFNNRFNHKGERISGFEDII